MLIIEGLVSPPIAYRRMRQRLLDRGAAGVDLGPVRVHDWVWAGLRGFDRLDRQVADAIEGAHGHAGGRPIMVVGHSGGGILARLAMSAGVAERQDGHIANMVGCLVTLGTPHDLHRADARWQHAGVRLARLLAERSPGARFAPTTGYVTVASDAVRPRPVSATRPAGATRPMTLPKSVGRLRPHNPVRAARNEFFRAIVGTTQPTGSDGVVSVQIAHLEGARQVTFHDVHHGVLGDQWYGDASVIERWWPVALQAWRDALEARGR